ncbi:MAG: DinB family protein [Saprospiraceae bacterium]|jgi:hypothetical protein|nr:DinB family protein [Saprospiraceae bacterium]MBK6477562.1 DinB family protein [Saprospiraceae bacterium]MBK6816565.1 DinB family protein [Saprospiraceae bacterium]MBK7371090.1 DinB family protein [Saprospiraceae bacterium]MBK7436409.1 DinB family protein [Saprospiraceae bacterium]
MDKQKIVELILASHDSLLQSVKNLTEEQCVFSMPGKWSALQHLKHIELSNTPLANIFSDKDRFLSKKFGEAINGSRSYEKITSIYKSALAPGVRAPQTFVPEPISYNERYGLFDEFNARLKQLISSMELFSEAEIDRYLIPHPLVGKITMREMFYFTVFHAGHHQNNLIRDLGTM